jgi:hypothetical protein
MILQTHTWTLDTVVFMDENGYNLRLAGQPTVCLVNENVYYFEAYDCDWSKTDIPRGTKLSRGVKILKETSRN